MPGDWDNTPAGVIGNIWNVQAGHASEPGVVYAGTQPAGLFRSEDWGRSWRPVESINRHENRKFWSGTGGGDSCIHSIHVHPDDAKRIFLCVGAGGSYKSADGGKTWELFSQNAIVTNSMGKKLLAELVQEMPEALPPGKDPAAIDELHRMRLDPKNPDRIWGQAHFGAFRSDDAGATWTDVTEGLPSFHGFPIAVTHHDPDGVFVVPLDYGQDNFRVALGQFTRLSHRRRRQELAAAYEGPARARTTTRAFTARAWTLTASTPRASTSAPATARSTPAQMAAKAGCACRGRCRRCSR